MLIANPRDTKRVMMILKNENFSAISCVNTLFASFLDDLNSKSATSPA